MPEKDTSKPGPVANVVFAALWLGLLVWTVASPEPRPFQWLLVAGYLVMISYFVVRAVRLLRARTSPSRR